MLSTHARRQKLKTCGGNTTKVCLTARAERNKDITEMNSRLNESACSLDGCLPNKEVNLDAFKKLTVYVSRNRPHLEDNRKQNVGPVKSLIKAVRML